MANGQSAFSPPDPASFEGPFSGFLRPPAPNQATPQVHGPVGKAGGIATVAASFLEGATKGRIKAFEQKENEKLQRLNSLQGYVTQIANDPNLTDEAKQFATQQFYRSIGGEISDVTKGAGKGGKGGSGGGGEGQDTHHHVIGILKTLAEGMTGGKAPKGAPDVGATLATIQGQIYGSDGKPKPEYSRPGQTASILSQMEDQAKQLGPDATQEQLAQKIGQFLPNLRKVAGADADKHLNDFMMRYQPAPKIGSEEYNMQKWNEMGKAHPVPPGSPAPPVTGGHPATPPEPSSQSPQSSSAPLPSAPTGRVFSPTELMIAQRAGAVGPMEQVEFVGSDGKQVITQAQRVMMPNAKPMFVDASGVELPVEASKVRKWTTAPPRTPTYSQGEATANRDMTLPDGTVVKKGQVYHWRQLNEPDSKREITGIGKQPVPPRPLAPPRPHVPTAAEKKLERQIGMYDALSKVISQTEQGGGLRDAKGQPLEGSAYARAIGDHVRRYYLKDTSVSPYLAEIQDWVNTESRKGSLKGDVVGGLKVQQSQAEQQKSQLEAAGKTASRDQQIEDALNWLVQETPAKQDKPDPYIQQ